MRLPSATDWPLPAAKRFWTLVALMIVLLVVTAIRIRLLNMPLERDEGEYAYGAQLLLQGDSPYKHAYNVMLKLPGTCAAYALAMAVFGQTTVGIHSAVILINLATALLVFSLTKWICGEAAGVVAAGTFALLAISPPTLGLAAHAVHFILLPALAGIFLLQTLDERTPAARIFFAGMLLGLALLMKQTGAAFGIFAAAWIVRCEMLSAEKSRRRLAARLGWLALGGLLPFCLACGLIVRAGDWGQFWLWTVQSAGAHAAVITFAAGMKTAQDTALQLFQAAPGLWSLALAGLILVFFAPGLRPWRFFLLSFFAGSVLAAYPGWRGHYFIQLLPAIGLLAGVTFYAGQTLLARWQTPRFAWGIAPLVFAIAAVSALIQWNGIYFRLTPAQVSRAIYGTNPFPESVEIGRYLAAHCAPDGRIVVLGSEPEIYFYSRHRAATGYICTYPLMEPQPYAGAMQKEMIRQIESANPDYVVFVHVPGSWLQYSDSNVLIFDWFGKYSHDQLQLVGVTEILEDGAAYHWFDPQDARPSSASEYWLAIYKQRSAGDHLPPANQAK